MKKILKFVAYLTGILILIVILIRLFFPIYNVATYSMEPTINKDDYIIINKLHYLFFEPNKSDIVLFEPIDQIFEEGPWIHRIIATEGDLVSIKNNSVFVNGNNALFPGVHYRDLSITIPKGFVFQKGDNEKAALGIVPKEKIIGKAIFSF